MTFAHARLLLVAIPAWCWALLWLVPRAAQADALSAEFRAYDWTSLLYAGALGLLGGALALIVALASDRRVVREVWGESWRNTLVSPIGGVAMYLVLKGLVGLGWVVLSTEPRFALIVGAGWAGIELFVWGRGVAGRAAAAFAEWAINRGGKP